MDGTGGGSFSDGQSIFQIIGQAFNGIAQAWASFIDMIVQLVPNPDPFPALIANISTGQMEEWGYAAYWLDRLIGVGFMRNALTVWCTMLVAGAAFAIIYWVIKAVKP